MENADIVIEYVLAIRDDLGAIKADVRHLKSHLVNIEAGQSTLMQLLGWQVGGTTQPEVSLGPSKSL